MLFARRRIALSAAITASLTTTLWLGEATAQSAAAPATAPTTTPTPAAATPVLPAASTLPGTSTQQNALPDWSGESADARADRVVLKPPSSTRWLLVGAGLASTAAWYGASYGIGALWTDAPGRKDLRIPVAGPFIDLAKTGCPKDDSDCSTFELVVRTILVSLDALGQAGGVGLLIEGAVFSPSGVEPPRSAHAQRSQQGSRAPSMVAIPMAMGQSGAGLGVIGSF